MMHKRKGWLFMCAGLMFSLAAFSGCVSRASQTSPMFRFVETEGNTAEAFIDLSRVSDYRVSERLFGKFTENLGANVYGGFWAQILDNPSLEPVSVCRNENNYAWHEFINLKNLTGLDLPDPYEVKNLPYRWFRWNGEACSYQLRDDACNTSHSLFLETKDASSSSPDAGIRQPVFLPIHRVKKYRISLYVKQATARFVAQIMTLAGDRILGKVVSDPSGISDWTKMTATLEIDAADVKPGEPLWFCLGIMGKGTLWVDQICLFPEDAIEGFDPEVVRLLKDQGIRLLRFPGGNYVSGYHWKDDAVPLDKRPTMKNPAWDQYDPHHAGTDEHIALCRLIGAEPLICVNAGNGTPQEAADWVEYCNGGPDTQWGRVRAELGHTESYNVKVWEIGNELWGPWQIGNCDSNEYARRYREFYRAMKAADPSIHLLATGNPSPGLSADWNEVLIKECPDILHSLTLHFLCENNPLSPPDAAFLSQMGYSYFFEDAFFRPLWEKGRKAGIDLKIAVTEEMIFNHRAYHPRPDTLAEALYYTGTLCSAIRTEGIVEIFTHSAILNHGGNMTKEKSRVFVQPVYYALQELTRLAGTKPVSFEISCPFSDVPERIECMKPDQTKFPLVDFMPLKGRDGLDIILANRDPNLSFPVTIEIPGGKFKTKARLFELTGKNFLAMNDFLNPDRVKPRVTDLTLSKSNALELTASPASLYVISILYE